MNQPGILLSKHLEDLPIASYHPPKIKEMMDMLATNSANLKTNRATQRELFLNEFEHTPISHLLMTKSISVTVRDPEKKIEVEKTMKFTFYSLVSFG
jgi:hypothetical protein